MKLSEKITILRKRNNLTQAKLGEYLFVTDKAVSKWESGKSEPDLDTLNKMAKLFNVDVKYLVSDSYDINDIDSANKGENVVREKTTVEKRKIPFKSFAILSGEITLFLTIAVIAVVVILNIIGNVTDRVTGLFDNWYQIVLFALDIFFLSVTLLFVGLEVAQTYKFKNYRLIKKGKSMKALSPTIYGATALFFVVLFIVGMVGGDYAIQNRSSINAALNFEESVKVGGGDTYYTSDYLNEDGSLSDEKLNKAAKETVKEVSDEGVVLLWNKNNALPLAKESKVNLFGMGSVKYLLSGFGNHDTYASQTEDMKTVFETGNAKFDVNDALFNKYNELASTGNYGEKNVQGSATNNPKYNGSTGYLDGRYREYFVREPSWSTLTSPVTDSVSQYKDAAIFIISRNASEDGDVWFPTSECLDNTYLDLSKEEAQILEQLKSKKDNGELDKIVVILNTKNVMQMQNLTLEKYGVDACLFAGLNGSSAYYSLGDILVGDVNPSGSLVDTIAYDIDSAPATVNTGDFRWTSSTGLPATDLGVYNDFYLVYQEGIYVGYRYYETRYEDVVLNQGNANSIVGAKKSTSTWKYQDEVAFPFGFGESYTDFEFSNYSVRHNEGEFGGDYTVSVDVKNIGSRSGKTSIQVYLQKPYTDYDVTNKVEKASVELAGFAKSDILEPNETKTYSLTVKGSELKTYDAYGKGTYILEKGDYYLSIGKDSHDALNNILASKGYSSSNGMVSSTGESSNGNSSLAYKINIENDDFETYSVSEHTGYEIKNQLSSTADLNVYNGTKDDQSITYLSRSNWASTYPVAPISLNCNNQTMVYDMQYDHAIESGEGLEMPIMDQVTVSDEFLSQFADLKRRRLSLIMLRGYDFDDPIWDDLLNQLSWADLNNLTSGGYLTLHSLTSVNAPSGVSRDGTFGLILNGIAQGIGYPASNVASSTFNTELIEKMGNIFGNECLHKGVHQLYGPSADMHRTPYGGRNAEYYSEDPFMSGKMLTAECKGIEDKGIMVCAKHFAFNDQEMNRCGVATFLNEQSAREIYLKGWEMAFNSTKISSIMASFARLGTRYVGACVGLMDDILRKEWNFKGFVETDSAFDQEYMTTPNARAEAVIAGVDYWMDGGSWLHFDGFKNNPKVVLAVRESAHRMLYAYVNSAIMNGTSSNTQIITVTPPWINAITALRIVSGILAGLSIVGLIISLVFYFKDKEKYITLYEADINNEKKFKKIELISSASFMSAVCAGLAIFLGVSLTSGVVQDNLKNDQEQSENILNEYPTSYEFKVTDGLGYFDADSKGVNNEESCIGIRGENYENEYVFGFEASGKTTALLTINISGSNVTRSIMDTFKPYVNGVPYYTSSVTNVGELWTEYFYIDLGEIEINKGYNCVSFIYVEPNPGVSLNLRGISLYTKANITQVSATRPNYIEYKAYTFDAIDYRVVTNGGKNSNENCIGAYYVSPENCTLNIDYIINAEEEGTYPLFYTVSTASGLVTPISTIYETWINEESITANGNMPTGGNPWTSYSTVLFGNVKLNKGNNTIHIEYDWNNTNNAGIPTTNFRNITLYSNKLLSLSEPEHSCSHVCSVCGGCLDDNCVFSSCRDNKCKCARDEYVIGADQYSNIYGHLNYNSSKDVVEIDNTYEYGYVEYDIISSTSGAAKFAMTISRNSTDVWPICDYFRIWINNGSTEEYESGDKSNVLSKGKYTAMTVSGSSQDFDTIEIGLIDLKEGDNKIVIGWTAVGNSAYAFSLKDVRLTTVNNTIIVK